VSLRELAQIPMRLHALLLLLLVMPGCALFSSATDEARKSVEALEIDLASYAAISTAIPGIPGETHQQLGDALQAHLAALREAVQ